MILFFVSSQFWIPLKFVSIIREELSFADILPGHPAFIIQSYGSVLSPLSGGTKTYSDSSSLEDLDQGNLSRALGSVVGIASLRAEGGVGPQLTSHTFGLLKARNTEYQTEEDKWLSSDEGTEWVLRTVDEVLDGVSSEEPQDQQVKAKLWYGKRDFQTFLYIPLLDPKNNKVSFKNQKESFPAPPSLTPTVQHTWNEIPADLRPHPFSSPQHTSNIRSDYLFQAQGYNEVFWFPWTYMF